MGGEAGLGAIVKKYSGESLLATESSPPLKSPALWVVDSGSPVLLLEGSSWQKTEGKNA